MLGIGTRRKNCFDCLDSPTQNTQQHMGMLGHLFYPWGFILQALALIHYFRRRGETFWLFVIFFGCALGALVYMVVEVVPDFGLIRVAFQSHGRKARIQVVEATILDNPSVANLEELGELYFDEKQYPKAREMFGRAIATRSDSPHSYYRRGYCALILGDPAAAIPDLEMTLHDDPKTDSYRAGMFLSQAYAATGRSDDAAALFADVMKYSSTPEMLYSYAAFLKSQNRLEESREWTQRLFDKKRTLPHYMQRIERPWFAKGKALLAELNAPPAKQTVAAS